MIILKYDTKDFDPEKILAFLEPPEVEKLIKAINGDLTRTGNLLMSRTTNTWKHKPKFERLNDVKGAKGTILIGTDDPIWNWLDQGTKGPYLIPKPGNLTAKALHFQGRYTAKTKVGMLHSYSGGGSGSYITRKHVTHPGIKARGWGDKILAALEKMLPETIGKRLEEAWERSNKR